jgi:hypothetical protein
MQVSRTIDESGGLLPPCATRRISDRSDLSARRCAIGLPLVATLYLALLGGCGPTCRQIARAEAAARARRAATTAPHAQLRVPLEKANAWLARAVAQEGRFPLDVPAMGPFLPPLQGFVLRLTSLTLEPAAVDHIGFRARAELFDGDTAVLGATLSGTVRPRLDTPPGRSPSLVISPSKELLSRLRPRFDPGSARALGDSVYRRLPSAARRLVDREQVRALSRQLLSMLESEGLQQFRDAILPRFGRLLNVHIRLPDLPLQRSRLRWPSREPRALVVDLYTTLPVHTGLAERPAAGTEVELRFAGSTVAELANWALAEGLMPRRYNGSLEPKADGPNTLVFDWTARTTRPMKMEIYRHRAPCARIRVGARAALALRDEQLTLTIEERKIEEVDGSGLVKLKLWYDQLWQGALEKTYSRAASTRLSWGERGVRLRIQSAALLRDELRLELAIDPSTRPGVRAVGERIGLLRRPLAHAVTLTAPSMPRGCRLRLRSPLHLAISARASHRADGGGSGSCSACGGSL